MSKDKMQPLLDILKGENITDPQIIAAFTNVPRHVFVPEASLKQVYADTIIPISYGQDGYETSTAIKPSMIADMLLRLHVQPGHNVLEIGTGRGYVAALLQFLVGSTGKVTTIEIERDVVNEAVDKLSRVGFSQVNVVNADGALGYAPRAAYDRILSNIGLWDIPPIWVQQLKTKGRMVVPLWLDGLQVSAVFTAESDGTIYGEDAKPSMAVYIRGQAGLPDIRRRVGSTALALQADEIDKLDMAALSLLLAEDHDYDRLSSSLSEVDYWYGFLPFMMLNESRDDVFALYSIREGQQAFGMDGEGFALFTPASACFVPYLAMGAVHCFAGSDALISVERQLAAWNEAGRPGLDQLKMRLIPIEQGKPDIQEGKLYTRRDHYLHVWYAYGTTG